MNKTEIEVLELKCRDITECPLNARIADDDAIKDLAKSIRANGVLNPIIVRGIDPARGDGFSYEVLAGSRRLNAAQEAGLWTITARIVDCSDAEAAIIAAAENVDRKSFTVAEEAAQFSILAEHWTPAQISERIGVSDGYVQQMLALGELPDATIGAISSGQIDRDAAVALTQVNKDDQAAATQQLLFPAFQDFPLTGRQATAYIDANFLHPKRKQDAWLARRGELTDKHPGCIIAPDATNCPSVASPGYAAVDAHVPGDEMKDGAKPTTWGKLAKKYKLSPMVVPGASGEDVIVDIEAVKRADKDAGDKGVMWRKEQDIPDEAKREQIKSALWAVSRHLRGCGSSVADMLVERALAGLKATGAKECGKALTALLSNLTLEEWLGDRDSWSSIDGGAVVAAVFLLANHEDAELWQTYTGQPQ